MVRCLSRGHSQHFWPWHVTDFLWELSSQLRFESTSFIFKPSHSWQPMYPNSDCPWGLWWFWLNSQSPGCSSLRIILLLRRAENKCTRKMQHALMDMRQPREKGQRAFLLYSNLELERKRSKKCLIEGQIVPLVCIQFWLHNSRVIGPGSSANQKVLHHYPVPPSQVPHGQK